MHVVYELMRLLPVSEEVTSDLNHIVYELMRQLPVSEEVTSDLSHVVYELMSLPCREGLVDVIDADPGGQPSFCVPQQALAIVTRPTVVFQSALVRRCGGQRHCGNTFGTVGGPVACAVTVGGRPGGTATGSRGRTL